MLPGRRCVMRGGGYWGCRSWWWLLGLPFVVVAFVPCCVLGWQACIAALVIASLASFVVYVPLTVLALNGGGALAEDTPASVPTARAYAAAPHLT